MTNTIGTILDEIIHAFDNEDAPLDILLAHDDHGNLMLVTAGNKASVYLEADQYYKVTIEAAGSHLPQQTDHV